MSWSLSLSGEWTSLNWPGRVVRIKSNVFFSRVGKCTICSKPWSFIMSINICRSDWLNVEPDLLSLSGQSISLKLKSPRTWTEGSFLQNHKFNNRVCMLLTGLPVALSRDNRCVGTGSYQKCREKEFLDSIYQHLSKLTIEFRCHFIDISVYAFPIEIPDAVILCDCLFLTRFVMFSNGRHALYFSMFFNCIGGTLEAMYSVHTMHVRVTYLFIFDYWLLPQLPCVSFRHMWLVTCAQLQNMLISDNVTPDCCKTGLCKFVS